MIVIVSTIVVLVVGVLSLALTVYGGYISTGILDDLKGDSESKHSSEQKYYLLGMIGIIVLLARLLVVPVFFWMIQALVPYCPGAMCAYGVINVGSPFSLLSLGSKLFLPFIYGLWLILELKNRGQPTMPLLRDLSLSFVAVLFPLVLFDSAADVLFVATIRPVYAPCCSSIYDVDPPFSPSAVFGPTLGLVIVILTIVVSLILAAYQWVEGYSLTSKLATVFLAIIAGALYLIALHDTYAPLVLGLSTHHCPFCLFQEFPDIALFSGLFWFGLATGGWRIGLNYIWIRKGLSP
ncbi:MAG: hypothetical protein RTU92_14875, partial [Candidatus Thorarchaeota archaeon]